MKYVSIWLVIFLSLNTILTILDDRKVKFFQDSRASHVAFTLCISTVVVIIILIKAIT